MSDQDSDIDILEAKPGTSDDRATNVKSELLPLSEKSRKQYEKIYQNFMEWKLAKNTSSFCEFVLLAYFEDLSNKFKSTSLWTFYSMLKSTLNIKQGVDISRYSKLTAFLKQINEGKTVKKAKTFSQTEIDRFLKDAPDRLYLMTKVGLIFGIMGACRRHELYNIMFNDVQDLDSVILVTIHIHNPKAKMPRIFTITGDYCNIVRKYIQLRPSPCTEPSFFLKYVAGSGKCSPQKVGINKFGNLGKTIAEFINLPDADMYTGHCFRRTATMSVDAVADNTERTET